MNNITLADIEAIPKEVLTPADVAAYLGVGQHSINCASKAGLLPWAYNIGNQTKIPKKAFIKCHTDGIPIALMRGETLC